MALFSGAFALAAGEHLGRLKLQQVFHAVYGPFRINPLASGSVSF
jgi:hypothetical protein